MKKRITLLAATLMMLLYIPGNAANKKKTIEMNKSMFIEKVADLKNYSETWNYLGDKPAIIEFYTTWCSYCKKLAPVLDNLAEEYDGKISIYTVDAEKEADLAQAFGIRSFPTMIFIPMKDNPQMLSGAYPKNDLTKIIEQVLLKK